MLQWTLGWKSLSCMWLFVTPMGFPGGSEVKVSAWNAGDLGLIPGLGRSPGEGKGYPLQYSGLENSMDCIVHGVPKSGTGLSNLKNKNKKRHYKHMAASLKWDWCHYLMSLSHMQSNKPILNWQSQRKDLWLGFGLQSGMRIKLKSKHLEPFVVLLFFLKHS